MKFLNVSQVKKDLEKEGFDFEEKLPDFLQFRHKETKKILLVLNQGELRGKEVDRFLSDKKKASTS